MKIPSTSNQPIRWANLYGAGLAWAIANAYHTHDGPIMVSLANPRQLQVLADELKFFLGPDDSNKVQLFPDWEMLTYDLLSPHHEIISCRLKILAHLSDLEQGIILVSSESLLHRLAPRDYILGHSFNLNKGDILDIPALRKRLTHVGYHSVDQVLAQGEFAVRGGIVDIFAMGSEQPFRLDLFGDEIDAIRYFDPQTQRSLDALDCINLLPARELPLTEAGIQTFRHAFRSEFSGDPSQQVVYEEISKGLTTPGIEFYLPLFYKKTASFFEYLPKNTLLIFEGDHQNKVQHILAQISDRYEARCHDASRKILAPIRLYLDQAQYSQQSKLFKRIQYFGQTSKNVDWRAPCVLPADYTINPKAIRPYKDFAKALSQSKMPSLIAVETSGRESALIGVLHEYNIDLHSVENWQAYQNSIHPHNIVIAPLDRGMRLSSPNLQIISESQLYGEKIIQRRQRRQSTAMDPEAIISSLVDLQIDAPVVHIDHGVGRYRGLQVLDVDGYEEEFLTISYQGNDKLYVPIQSLNLISRFVGGDPSLAPIHKLGGSKWDKSKKAAREKSYDVAVELLQMQAAREARSGTAMKVQAEPYAQFVERFSFEETHDQQRAIEDVLADLCSAKPMDRLVCGDVGFGKTEVAMRAAFVVASNQRQVLMLVPTTLLTQQHFASFEDRFAKLNIRIGLLSRFSSVKQSQEVLDQLADGKIDIVIGTHRLIQPDVKVKNLGLIIIDEEHRFGVRQKERLKSLRHEVDILTLTATPIPRTLNMTMAGLREISIIASPPRQRLAIKTLVMQDNDAIVREACLREIHRGGQTYVLHNEVKTIQRVCEELAQLMPEAKVAFAHGQMRELQLEQVMRDFYHQRINILVATTIIESGIDIPSANTIIIHRADKFGLAQLHQLRGRVGRSRHQAFAYLFVPSLKGLTGDAKKRLDAIAKLEDLGAGFSLASHDLEIRGAGELLGETQSGMIDDVGFNLYSDYLNRAIASLKENSGKPQAEAPAERFVTEMHMGFAALFPNDYLPDVHLRLVMYKRIASAKQEEQLKELEIEAIDRFGLLPDSAKNLFRVSYLKLKAHHLGVQKIDVDDEGGEITFIEKPAVDINVIISLIQENPRVFHLSRSNQLSFTQDLAEHESRIHFVERLLGRLSKQN